MLQENGQTWAAIIFKVSLNSFYVCKKSGVANCPVSCHTGHQLDFLLLEYLPVWLVMVVLVPSLFLCFVFTS